MAAASDIKSWRDNNYLSGSLMAALRQGCVQNPGRLMVEGNSKGITYERSLHMAQALAWYLRRTYKVKKGSIVFLSACNIVEYPIVIAAVQECSACIVLLPSAFERDDVVHALRLLRPSVALVGYEPHANIIKKEAPQLPLVIVGRNNASLPCLQEIVHQFDQAGCPNFSSQPSNESQVVLFTSGSTGTPKAVVHRSRSFARNAAILAKSFLASSDDKLYLPVPFAHVYGLIGIYIALFSGATLITLAKYTPAASLSLIASTGATLYFGVATMYTRELKENQGGDWEISSLRAGLVAGSNCPKAVFVEYQEKYGCCLMQSYGMTETAATLTVSSLDWPLGLRASSAGVAAPGVQLKLDEHTGEILCKSESMMQGIMREGGVADPPLEEGWFRTGDRGVFDAKARLSIVGRIKDMIIRGGVNIYPAEIENVYQNHPHISECHLVSYPDSELGERTCLCCTVKQQAQDEAYQLRQFAYGKIEKCKVPDMVLILDSLPHLANGKIDREVLKARTLAILSSKSFTI